MSKEEERPQTFLDAVLALLEERFPWLGSGKEESVSGAETVDELADFYQSLARERGRMSRKDDNTGK